MAPRRLGWCSIAALVLCTLLACGKKSKKDDPNSPDLDARCEQLGKACGDSDKHTAKIVDDCKQASLKQIEKSCTDKARVAYDCYEKELCGKADKVWALDDLRVLTGRHKKCVAETTAVADCVK